MSFCAAQRGFRRGVPTTDWCAACEGQTVDARREARAVAADQDVAATRLVERPEDLADLARYGARSFLIGEALMRQAADDEDWFMTIIRGQGLVATRKDAKLVYYRIDETKLGHVTAALAQFAGEAVGSEAPVRRRTSAPGVANFAQLG